MKKIFITGIAGMIGFHAALRFKRNGWNVVGIDNLNDYYDVQLKNDRVKILKENDIDFYFGNVMRLMLFFI